MHSKKRSLTLGDVIQTVSRFSHNEQEMSLTVVDLVRRGVIKPARPHKHFRIVTSRD